ncbi:MAG: hypothetical protein RIE08_10895 [Acidimicrobiales bacterium]
MTTLKRLLPVALGLFLVASGIAKFATGHVFQYIEYRSGIDLFYPFINNLTGIAEIVAGAAILYRPIRLAGSLLASALMIGAIGFHLSPWLGVSIPTGLADGAATPWDASDFATSTTSVSFFLAIVTGLGSLATARRAHRARNNPEATNDAPATSADADLVRA